MKNNFKTVSELSVQQIAWIRNNTEKDENLFSIDSKS